MKRTGFGLNVDTSVCALSGERASTSGGMLQTYAASEGEDPAAGALADDKAFAAARRSLRSLLKSVKQMHR
jgi:hypothetical protein